MTKADRDIAIEMITNSFMWSFKKGDNIIYNLNVLWVLYRAQKTAKDGAGFFVKPMIVTITAITECILEDFVTRIFDRNIDPLPNITPKVVSEIKYKGKDKNIEIRKLSEFNHYIAQIKKHDLFGKSNKFYDALDLLRQVRNRVHIQNNKALLEPDEVDVYTEKRLLLAEKVLEVLIKEMIIKFPRNKPTKRDISEFPFPWKTHKYIPFSI